MNQSELAACIAVVAAEQKPSGRTLADRETQVAIGESEIHLIFAAQHRQTFRPSRRIISLDQIAMQGINTPGSPAARTKNDEIVEPTEQSCAGCRVGMAL